MIPNNTKSGIISIIRFSGEKKHSTFSAASLGGRFRVNAEGKAASGAGTPFALTAGGRLVVDAVSTRKMEPVGGVDVDAVNDDFTSEQRRNALIIKKFSYLCTPFLEGFFPLEGKPR